MARWAEYFEQLFTVDPPSGQLRTAGLQTLDTDPPIDEIAPAIGDVKEAVAKLRGGKTAGICNISAGLLRARDEAMLRGFHAVLTVVWHSGTIPPHWIKEGERRLSGLQQLPWYNTAQHTRQDTCPFAVDADLQSSAETAET